MGFVRYLFTANMCILLRKNTLNILYDWRENDEKQKTTAPLNGGMTVVSF